MVNGTSPTVQRLAQALCDGVAADATDELAAWLASEPRFRAFAETHRDKIRKKLRGAADAESRLGVLAELNVARRLLGHRRIELAFEPGGATRGGPDFAVSVGGAFAFNLEVTRPRRVDTLAVGRIVLAKIRQLPAGAANVLLVATADAAETDIGAAARGLRAGADAADAGLLARGGFSGRRDFYQSYLRLGAVVIWSEGLPQGRRSLVWVNPSARIPVPARALRGAVAALDG